MSHLSREPIGWGECSYSRIFLAFRGCAGRDFLGFRVGWDGIGENFGKIFLECFHEKRDATGFFRMEFGMRVFKFEHIRYFYTSYFCIFLNVLFGFTNNEVVFFVSFWNSLLLRNRLLACNLFITIQRSKYNFSSFGKKKKIVFIIKFGIKFFFRFEFKNLCEVVFSYLTNPLSRDTKNLNTHKCLKIFLAHGFENPNCH